MELLLNLAWVTLALMALGAFLRQRRSGSRTARIPYTKALLALACVLVLLFPVVSASDDLHPTQAVLEDATKRISQMAAPLQHLHGNGPMTGLPAMLAVLLLCSLPVLQWRQPDVQDGRLLAREHLPRVGRAPPSF
jgi:hypothetical protein